MELNISEKDIATLTSVIYNLYCQNVNTSHALADSHGSKFKIRRKIFHFWGGDSDIEHVWIYESGAVFIKILSYCAKFVIWNLKGFNHFLYKSKFE